MENVETKLKQRPAMVVIILTDERVETWSADYSCIDTSAWTLEIIVKIYKQKVIEATV